MAAEPVENKPSTCCVVITSKINSIKSSSSRCALLAENIFKAKTHKYAKKPTLMTVSTITTSKKNAPLQMHLISLYVTPTSGYVIYRHSVGQVCGRKHYFRVNPMQRKCSAVSLYSTIPASIVKQILQAT
jgi:hypothetical protein